ncbi:RNA polymerase subunit sigma-70 [Desulfonema ishimotonii]|uniref:RNA polymerase subunit sigma-70 n=2 Tax=Desulfonema ishimotonii TaxID=45657 RepID=A0A401FU03_9BACT|nr:RNA polymerase subunit sigma-70 [Desulfonema ishimotonii]
MGAEQYALRRDINRLRRSCSDPEAGSGKLAELEKRIHFSIEKRAWRRKNRPRPVYDSELPIVAKKEEIVRAISENRVVIISGETGSGKTTQIPKFCLEAGRGIDGRIGCTQPRRIAAMTVSGRIAEELGEDPGQSVGHKIRFQDQTGENAFIKIMTDGILLAETQGDPWLNEYDTLIVDEAHERSLNIDFVLGILKTLVRKRRDLKLIITSATIDTEKFSKAFDNAPVIEVSGRMYPVEVRYMAPDGKADEEDQTHVDLAVKAVHKLQQESPYGGDILVFMPTEQDIRETCGLLEGRSYMGVSILPLFGRLSAGDQSRVFARMTGRKIIVATNVAETSITIPGIKYVVDTGLARISQYSPRSRTTGLPVLPISRSSADQRKGRCGRVANGVCIRLYPEEDYENRPRFTPPEILRSNLAEVILRMIALRLGDVRAFPFIDRPADKNIQDGFRLLDELGAIVRKNGRDGTSRLLLTERGKTMARLPLDPRISRMLIEAREEECLEEMMVIASALSIQDPRERPTDKETQANQAHARFKDTRSDFITLLNIWNIYHENRKQLRSTGKMRKYCKQNFLSFRRMREWRDIHYQIAVILDEQGLKNKKSEGTPVRRPVSGDTAASQGFSPRYAAIHKAVLSGFLSNIATKKEKYIYRAAGERTVMLFPGSSVFQAGGQWVVAAEMVETSRLFARIVANIDVEWLESVGKAQCKYTYSRPRWERDRGEVTASEQVSLYGLIIVPERPVSYGRIHPQEASKIFIRSALVEGDVRQPLPFMKHNRSLIEEIRDQEDKIRRRDLLVNEDDLCAFYEKQLPENIYDIRSLKHFLKTRKSDNFLCMKKADLYHILPDREELNHYPDRISLGNTAFPCDYHFEPGHKKDGVTVKIASALATSVRPESLEWVVPGLFREKITALIKGLPKEYRKQLVPVSTTVEIIADEMSQDREISLITALSRFIYRRFGVDIPASAWATDDLPDHLKMRVAILGPAGEALRASRDAAILAKGISNTVDPDNFESARRQWERDGITDWDFGDLPDTVTLKAETGEKWLAWPGLKADGERLGLRLFRKQREAVTAHRQGVARLYALRFSRELRMLKAQLRLPRNMAQPVQYFGGGKAFEKQLYESIIEELFRKNIRTLSAFEEYARTAGPRISESGKKKTDGALSVLSAYHECRTVLFDLENANRFRNGLLTYLSGLRDALARLIPENFVLLYDAGRMIHLARYVRAIMLRARRGVVNFEKDQAKEREVKVQTDRLNGLLKELSPNVTDEKRQAIEDFFWLIEEYKVSLHAQELKTAVPVSPKRLEKKFGEIRRMV